MVNLKTIRLPVSANIKLALVAFAFAIVAGTLYYTNMLVEEMKRSERKTVQLFANIVQAIGNAQDGSTELSGMAYEAIQAIDFPIILTDDKKLPLPLPTENGGQTYSDFVRNVDFDTAAPIEQQKRALIERIAEMEKAYEPRVVYKSGSRDSIQNYIFYDDSRLVEQLQLLPIIEIVIIAMFILIGYLSFSYIKRNEQSNIWVGMAKETAHQLGTPLSSLLGWIELLRYDPNDAAQVIEAAGEMQRDVERLNKIALRFSKIGSASEVTPVELNSVLNNVIAYFERRLPHLGKRVTLTLEKSPTPVWAAINVDLFEWVFENLVRNAADAIDHIDGRIVLRVHEVRNTAIVDVIDNGRGIDPKIRKDIFRPGFSTKQRGWGLGLSLAKRIVEDYHGGRVAIKQSSSAGTTFRIRIPSMPAPATDMSRPTEVSRQPA